MQPIKLIAIDLDGTLLNEKKEISEESEEKSEKTTLEELKDEG